jgi:UDP-2,3-diacylglucosamine pyrophosphatase LpxH
VANVKKKYRTIFLSDIHLGSRGCQAKKLIKFLENTEADTIYLVGDIIDGWRMRRGIYWPQKHSEVIRLILKKASKGTVVHYIAGNHDEFLRKWMSFDLKFGNVYISNRQEYVSYHKSKLLVIHGDMFDVMMRSNLKWLMHIGDWSYNMLIWANTKLNWVREKLGLKYWSLSKYLKDRTKKAIQFIDNYEQNMIDYAHSKGYHGVICGHIHKAEMKGLSPTDWKDEDIPGRKPLFYMNCGDWVESCTALVEHTDGGFEVIYYEDD